MQQHPKTEKAERGRERDRQRETETYHFGFAGEMDNFVNLTQVKVIKEISIRDCMLGQSVSMSLEECIKLILMWEDSAHCGRHHSLSRSFWTI